MTKLQERHQKTVGLTGLKANATAGEFEAIVAVFGNVDLGGDRILPGAFAKSLAAWNASGDPIPVLWNHDRANPLAHIGKVLEAKEVDQGLWIRGALDLDRPFAAQVFHLLAERRVKEFSFAYNVVAAAPKDGAYELKELELIEVGPTLQGMNPATQLLAVKSYAAAQEAGERHDADLLDRLARLKAATKTDVEEEIAQIFGRLGIPVPSASEKSASTAPPVAKKPPVLNREPQRFDSGAYLGGLPRRPTADDDHRGKAHQYVTGGFQLIDLDEQLADAEEEAKQAAQRAADANERLEAAREAVKRADALRDAPDAA